MIRNLLLACLFFSNIAFAYVYFTDEDSFDDWYADSALTMLAYQVMEGYDDGGRRNC